jgi:hypothetical protein
MTKRESIQKELQTLHKTGLELAMSFAKNEEKIFEYAYQSWYTVALKAVASLAPDRYSEFRSYYEIDPKRKSLGYGTYVIQDYIKNVRPGGYANQEFDAQGQVVTRFINQLAIVDAINSQIDSVLCNIEGELYAELQDNEVATARQLAKVSLRAAGALVGVLIEGHLQKVATAHSVKIAKKNPTIADLNDPLKAASIIDTPTWRRISFLSDIRNLCSHKKDDDPTKDQVEDLIRGAEWLTKNVS